MNPISGHDAQSSGGVASPKLPGQAKGPLSVLVISVIEIAFGLLAIGLVLESQANSFNPAPVYLAIYAYASALFLAGALAFLTIALLSSQQIRPLRLASATTGVAAATFVMAAGYSILTQVSTWTTPYTCDGCPPSTPPTVNQVVASVVLDIGGGALAALLPVVVLVLLRNRRETAAAATTVPSSDRSEGSAIGESVVS